MNSSRFWHISLLLALLALAALPTQAANSQAKIGINVVLNTAVTSDILADLGKYGTVRDVVYEIQAVTVVARSTALPQIQALSYVKWANPDANRDGIPVSTLAVTDFSNGLNTWDLDAINVTDFGNTRTVAYDGSGVYVAVLDTGLVGL